MEHINIDHSRRRPASQLVEPELAEQEEEAAAGHFRYSRLEPLDSYRLNAIQLLFRRCIGYITFVYCLDCFLVYKRPEGQPGRAKFRQFQRPQLRLELGRADRRRESWRRWQLSLLVYLCARYFSIMLLQLAIYRCERAERLARSASPLRQLLDRTSDLIGNPLGDASPLTITIYGCLIMALAQSFGQAPHIFLTKPPDALHIRLFMEPTRELRRIRLVVADSLDSLLYSIGQLRLHQRRPLDPLGPHHYFGGRRHQWLSRQRRLIEAHRARPALLRPAAYTRTFYRELFTSIMACCYSFYLTGNLLTCHLIGSLYALVLRQSEREQRLGLRWQEWLAMGELALGILISANTILCLLVAFIYNLRTQLVIALDVAFNLRLTLSQLELANQRAARYLLEPRHLDKAYGRVEGHLVASFVNLRQSDDEIRRLCAFLSDMLELMLTMAALAVLVSLASLAMEGPGLRALLATVLVPLWLATNLVLLGSAYTQARVADSEKLAWSMLAQLFVKAARSGRPLQDDVVASSWRRLMHGHELMNNAQSQNSFNWYSAHPFGMAITFVKVLELNFFVLSIAFLARSFKF